MPDIADRAVLALVVAPLYVLGVSLMAYAAATLIDALARFTARHTRRPNLWK